MISKDDIFCASALGCIALLICLGIWAAVENEKQWKQLAEDHDCKVVERIRGEVSTGSATGITSSGKSASGLITTVEPDRVVYLCNDGIKYTR